MKPFRVPEMNFKGYSRSSSLLYFVRSNGLSIRDRSTKLHLAYFHTEIAKMTSKGVLAMAQFNSPHTTFY